jgi:hypothetical protein
MLSGHVGYSLQTVVFIAFQIKDTTRVQALRKGKKPG